MKIEWSRQDYHERTDWRMNISIPWAPLDEGGVDVGVLGPLHHLPAPSLGHHIFDIPNIMTWTWWCFTSLKQLQPPCCYEKCSWSSVGIIIHWVQYTQRIINSSVYLEYKGKLKVHILNKEYTNHHLSGIWMSNNIIVERTIHYSWSIVQHWCATLHLFIILSSTYKSIHFCLVHKYVD